MCVRLKKKSKQFKHKFFCSPSPMGHFCRRKFVVPFHDTVGSGLVIMKDVMLAFGVPLPVK
jgi:hypothetical protein